MGLPKTEFCTITSGTTTLSSVYSCTMLWLLASMLTMPLVPQQIAFNIVYTRVGVGGDPGRFPICATAPFLNSSVVRYSSTVSTPCSFNNPARLTLYTRFTSSPNNQRSVSRLWLPKNHKIEDLAAHGSISVAHPFYIVINGNIRCTLRLNRRAPPLGVPPEREGSTGLCKSTIARTWLRSTASRMPKNVFSCGGQGLFD